MHLSNRMIVTELIDAVGKGRDVVRSSSGTDARAALEMIMAAHESHRFGSRTTFPMKNRENPYDVWPGFPSMRTLGMQSFTGTLLMFSVL